MVFVFKEAYRSVRAVKVYFLLAVLPAALGVALLHLTIQLSFGARDIASTLKHSFQVSLFLSDSVSSAALQNLTAALQANAGVAQQRYISKEAAADIFVKETGEDFRTVLASNPLPASILLTLKPEIIDLDRSDSLVSSFSGLPGVVEVGFEGALLKKILTQLREARLYLYLITAITLLVSIYIIFSILNLMVKGRGGEIETMKLVGSSVWMIRLPVILAGLLLGVLAGAAAQGLWYSVLSLLRLYIAHPMLKISTGYYSVVAGPLLGVLCGIIATFRISLKNN